MRYALPMRYSSLLLSLLVAAGCADSFPTPPHPVSYDNFPLTNFALVAPGVYRGSQPDDEQFRKMIDRYHIKSVVKLNQGHDFSRIPDGVTVVEEPINPIAALPADTVKRILDEIDAAPKPVFVHCTHGEDRTGLIVALWRMRHGTPVAEAYTDMMRRRFHPYTGLWNAWQREAGWDRPETPSTVVAGGGSGARAVEDSVK